MFSRDYPKSKRDWLTEQAAFLFCVFQRSGGKHEANARQRRGQRKRGAPLLACIYPPPPLPFPLAFASRMAPTPQQRNRMTSNLEGDPFGAFRVQIDRVNLILFDEY